MAGSDLRHQRACFGAVCAFHQASKAIRWPRSRNGSAAAPAG
jgi:hypothetical protein